MSGLVVWSSSERKTLKTSLAPEGSGYFFSSSRIASAFSFSRCFV